MDQTDADSLLKTDIVRKNDPAAEFVKLCNVVINLINEVRDLKAIIERIEFKNSLNCAQLLTAIKLLSTTARLNNVDELIQNAINMSEQCRRSTSESGIAPTKIEMQSADIIDLLVNEVLRRNGKQT